MTHQTPSITRDLTSVLFSVEEIQSTVAKMGEAIARDYQDKEPVVVCILKGAVFFFTDLLKTLDIPLTTDFMAISSYGASTKSSGVVRILKDLDHDVLGRDVLVVEDIVDSGLTLSYIKSALTQRGANSVKIATLLDKPARRQVELTADYVGFQCPDAFVVGYGLDYAEKYRNLPMIGVLSPHVYT